MVVESCESFNTTVLKDIRRKDSAKVTRKETKDVTRYKHAAEIHRSRIIDGALRPRDGFPASD